MKRIFRFRKFMKTCNKCSKRPAIDRTISFSISDEAKLVLSLDNSRHMARGTSPLKRRILSGTYRVLGLPKQPFPFFPVVSFRSQISLEPCLYQEPFGTASGARHLRSINPVCRIDSLTQTVAPVAPNPRLNCARHSPAPGTPETPNATP